jgi:hypothetical protein
VAEKIPFSMAGEPLARGYGGMSTEVILWALCQLAWD